MVKHRKQLLVAITISALLVSTTGCSKGMEPATETRKMKTRCIDGVEYIVFREISGYQGYGFMSAKFNRDGSIATCS